MILVFGGGRIARSLAGLDVRVLRHCDCDVTSPSAVRAAVSAAPNLTAVVVAAALNPKHTSADAWPDFHGDDYDGAEDWRVNVAGAVNVARAAIARWLWAGVPGSIVLLGSIHGAVSPDPRLYGGAHKPWAYSCTKAALPALARYVAAHYAAEGIRCNVVELGGVEDGFVAYAERAPAGRQVRLADVAGPVLWLCSKESAGVNGTVVRVDEGWTAI